MPEFTWLVHLADVFEDYVAHQGLVAALSMSYDESTLVTVGRDGCVMVFDVRDISEQSKKLELAFSDEVLISQSELEHLRTIIAGLEQTIETNMQQYDVNMKTRERELHLANELDKGKLLQKVCSLSFFLSFFVALFPSISVCHRPNHRLCPQLDQLQQQAAEEEHRREAEILRLRTEAQSSERMHEEEMTVFLAFHSSSVSRRCR